VGIEKYHWGTTISQDSKDLRGRGAPYNHWFSIGKKYGEGKTRLRSLVKKIVPIRPEHLWKKGGASGEKNRGGFVRVNAQGGNRTSGMTLFEVYATTK